MDYLNTLINSRKNNIFELTNKNSLLMNKQMMAIMTVFGAFRGGSRYQRSIHQDFIAHLKQFNYWGERL